MKEKMNAAIPLLAELKQRNIEISETFFKVKQYGNILLQTKIARYQPCYNRQEKKIVTVQCLFIRIQFFQMYKCTKTVLYWKDPMLKNIFFFAFVNAKQ